MSHEFISLMCNRVWARHVDVLGPHPLPPYQNFKKLCAKRQFARYDSITYGSFGHSSVIQSAQRRAAFGVHALQKDEAEGQLRA